MLKMVMDLLARTPTTKTIYGFKVADIDGKEFDLATLQGRPVVIANVASECGRTEAGYKQLADLHERYGSKGLAILAFPCNQFGAQGETSTDISEPGTAAEIKEFAAGYGNGFQLFSKIEVNGPNAHPLYVFLKEQAGVKDIWWNFEYFVIDRVGRVLSHVGGAELEAEVGAAIRP